MKIVKYVFLLLVLAAIAITVFIATQNGSYSITEQKVINVPRPVLYKYITEYKNWENLGLLKDADSTANYNYSNATSGNGAFMQWQKSSTTGKVTTIALVENDSISQQAVINDLESQISWKFKDTLNSTKVTVKLTGNLTFSEKANALMHGGIDNSFETTVSKGLDNLNAFLVTELRKYNIEVEGLVTKTGAFYLGHTSTGSIKGINETAASNFAKLQAFVAQNKITTAGYPFILYKNLDKTAQTATYTFAIPIKDEIFTAAGSEYEGGKITPHTALKTTLTGDYSHLQKAWKKAIDYINQKVLQENKTGSYIQVFATGSKQTRRPSQWQTDIYIPIGASANESADTMATDAPLPPINNTTAAKPATGIQPKPAGTSAKPANTGQTAKPASGTAPAAQKPAGATTTPKPSGTTTAKTGTSAKPAASTTATKPASTATTGNTPKSTGSNTATATKPAETTTKKPATNTGTGTTAKPKPAAKKPAESRADDMNPPRADD